MCWLGLLILNQQRYDEERFCNSRAARQSRWLAGGPSKSPVAQSRKRMRIRENWIYDLGRSSL